jgi:anti-sigma factor RsiW
MNDAQRELIAAYHDGELDADAALEARRLIDGNPEAGRYLAALARVDDTLRRALDPIARQPTPAVLQAQIQPPRHHHMWIPMALAASLALVAVLVVRQVGVDRQFQDQLAQMQQQIVQLRQQTLENVPSGTKASWVAPAGDARVDVMPVQTYRTPDNRYCREYEERIEDAQGVEIRRGIACRAGKALWSEQAIPGLSGTTL